MEETELRIPISESDVRKLKVGTAVYVSGTIHTMCDKAHRRAVEILERKEGLPFDLQNGAIWHCGPLTSRKGGKWEVLSAGPESSSRFTELGARLVERAKVRITIGKGTMGSPMIRALKNFGGIYLLGTGGCAAFYASKVLSVEAVHWEEFGMVQAVWALKAERLGPLIVGIDSEGNALAEIAMTKILKKTENILREENVDPGRTYIWWPRTVLHPL
jgi:tartrate/fumarate subfamily iron-sulfur-dependent hydro-lyase beta chain